MTALGLVFRVVGAWTLLVLLLVSGLAWITTAVDAAGSGPARAGLVAALLTPGLVVRIMPLICALGAGLAAARMMARGERVALENAGLAPARTGGAALLVGLLCGGLGWGAHADLVHRAEARVSALQPVALPAWVWTDGGPVRRTDGLQIVLSGGQIIGVQQTDLSEIWSEGQLQQPALASYRALQTTDRLPVRLERQWRWARIAACAGLAWLCWLPWARSPQGQVLAALLLGLCWQLTGLGLQGMALQGWLSPLFVALGPAVLMGLGVWFGTARTRRPVTSP